MGAAAGFLLVGAALIGVGILGAKTAGAATSAVTSSQAAVTGTLTAPPKGTRSMGQVRDYLAGSGLTKTAAAGVVGNLWQESSGDPATAGGGLAQWIGSRWTALQAFAAQHGLNPSSEDAQLQYLVSDLHGPYSGLLAQLNQARTPGEAATLFSNLYERPGNPQLANRVNYANQAFAA